MSILELKPKFDCRWDAVSLGEVLLRFDPEHERIHTARNFKVYEGGGEYNVARGLRKVFNQRTAVFTALARNPLGKLVEDLILQGGVDASQIIWRDGDEARNGLYFIERGFGQRAPQSAFDRSHTAISQLKPKDIDWNWVFGEYRSRWFHTGGIFAGLSDTTAKTAAVAMQFARKHGAVVSYDLNYRESLWKSRGGRDAAGIVNQNLLPFADVVFGVPGFDAGFENYEETRFVDAAAKLMGEYPNLKIVATTLRQVKSASRHNLSGVLFANYETFKARDYADTEVLDRVGSGDAFASGLIYALLNGKDLQFAIDCATAHAVLAMTAPGDNSTATLADVERLTNRDAANVSR